MKNLVLSEDKNIPVSKLNELFQKIGWERNPQTWPLVLEKSSFVISAWASNELIGFGRIMEDGVMCMFYDIGVDPSFQKRGVGTKIMEKLISKVKNKHYVSIGLFTWEENPSNISFYEKFGFEKVGTGMELVKYMKRE